MMKMWIQNMPKFLYLLKIGCAAIALLSGCTTVRQGSGRAGWERSAGAALSGINAGYRGFAWGSSVDALLARAPSAYQMTGALKDICYVQRKPGAGITRALYFFSDRGFCHVSESYASEVSIEQFDATIKRICGPANVKMLGEGKWLLHGKVIVEVDEDSISYALKN